MNTPTQANCLLLASIRPLCTVPSSVFADMKEELELSRIPWQAAYREYQSGGWLTAFLMNASGRITEHSITDGVARATSLMRQFPVTAKYVQSLGLDIMCMRLANMKPGACLFEHVDYRELSERPRLRLHIPIVTNAHAELILSEDAVHMSGGVLWMLDPQHRHAALNGGLTDRVHLLIDCYVNDKLTELLSISSLPVVSRPKPLLDLSMRANLICTADNLLRSQQVDLAERLLLRTFHQYSLTPGSSYDLLVELFGSQKSPELQKRLAVWRHRKTIFLGGVNE